MAKYCGSVCRLCRREGLKLFLKGDRCYSEKCAVERRAYAPGQHGQARVKFSEYGLQLREKQKMRRMYGLLEDQFRVYFHRAERMRGVTGENLLKLLESRFDNVVYRMGFCSSRSEARQFIRHGHFLVNDKKVTIPSYTVKPGSVVRVKDKSKEMTHIIAALGSAKQRGLPEWLAVDHSKFAGHFKDVPPRELLTIPMNEQLVVELYSK